MNWAAGFGVAVILLMYHLDQQCSDLKARLADVQRILKRGQGFAGGPALCLRLEREPQVSLEMIEQLGLLRAVG